MYIPKYYAITDAEEILDFVQANPFGTIVTIKQGKPIAAHLPLQVAKIDGTCYITGHLAYGNPLWRTFETCGDVLAIFQGADAYVSSSWYTDENVPTWNYQAVHMYGKPSIIEKEELVEDLTSLLEKYEQQRENPILWETLSPDLLEKEMKGIVGFRIKVEEIQAAYKMSQNRNETDYANIIGHLQKEKAEKAKQMAEQMKKRADHIKG